MTCIIGRQNLSQWPLSTRKHALFSVKLLIPTISTMVHLVMMVRGHGLHQWILSLTNCSKIPLVVFCVFLHDSAVFHDFAAVWICALCVAWCIKEEMMMHQFIIGYSSKQPDSSERRARKWWGGGSLAKAGLEY